MYRSGNTHCQIVVAEFFLIGDLPDHMDLFREADLRVFGRDLYREDRLFVPEREQVDDEVLSVIGKEIPGLVQGTQ